MCNSSVSDVTLYGNLETSEKSLPLNGQPLPGSANGQPDDFISSPFHRGLDSIEQRAAAVCRALVGNRVVLDNAPIDREELPRLIAETIVRSGVESSCSILQSHRECAALEAELLARDLDVSLYPRRDDDNCIDFRNVDHAQKLGLSAKSAVCAVCERMKENACIYYGEIGMARMHKHVIMTGSRAIHTDLLDECKSRDLVIIAPMFPLDVLAPRIEASMPVDVAVTDLDAIKEAADECKYKRRHNKPYGEHGFFVSLINQVDNLRAATLETSKSRSFVSRCIPEGWAVSFYNALRSRKVPSSESLKELVQICTNAVTGTLSRPPVVVTRTRMEIREKARGQFEFIANDQLSKDVYVDAVFPTRHLKQKILIIGATLDAEDIEKVLGEVPGVTDYTPPIRTAVQVAKRINGGSRTETIVKLVRNHLVFCHGAIRVVISKKRHKGVLKALGDDRGRVVLSGWFDRMDAGCTLALVMGQVPVHHDVVAHHLILTGRIEEAEQDSEWVERPWWGKMRDGTAVKVPRMGYEHEAWFRAHQKLQIGPTLGVLESIPESVVVYSTEDLGLSFVHLPCIEDILNAPPPGDDPKSVPTVGLRATEGLFLNTTLFSFLSSFAHRNPSAFLVFRNKLSVAPNPFTAKWLSTGTGLTERTVRKYLNLLVPRGLIERIGQRGGWRVIHQ